MRIGAPYEMASLAMPYDRAMSALLFHQHR
jgi:hypothetical protein